MSENGPTGLWNDYDSVYAGEAVSRTEVVEGISAVLSKFGDLSGERCESRAGRRGAMGEARMGGGEGRVSSARGDFDDGGGTVAAGGEEAVVISAVRRLLGAGCVRFRLRVRISQGSLRRQIADSSRSVR